MSRTMSFDGDEPGADAVFGEREDRGLGVVENGVGAVFAFKGALLNVVRGVNQIAQHRFFFDDARVMLHVGDARHAVGERSEIGRAAGSVQIAAAVQFFRERDEVNGLLAFAERDHLGENAAMLIEEEIFGLQMLDGGIERVVIEDDGAEDGTFGVEIIGEGLFENGVGRHGYFVRSDSYFAFSSPRRICSILPVGKASETKFSSWWTLTD